MFLRCLSGWTEDWLLVFIITISGSIYFMSMTLMQFAQSAAVFFLSLSNNSHQSSSAHLFGTGLYPDTSGAHWLCKIGRWEQFGHFCMCPGRVGPQTNSPGVDGKPLIGCKKEFNHELNHCGIQYKYFLVIKLEGKHIELFKLLRKYTRLIGNIWKRGPVF